MSIVEVKNVSFSYNDETEALKNVSFEVEKGSYTCILGHNGSGKSTVAKLMAGLLPLDNGKIFVDNKELNEENLSEIRSKLGIVFQNPDNQFIGSTVRDDMAFGLENYCVPQEKMDDIINKFASVVNMSNYLDSEPNNLSGGQKQRVAIAGILAMGPEIIIFDEATSMLDPRGKDEIKKVIYDLHADKDLTIISITHDIEEALRSDKIIVLNKGEVFMSGKPHEVFNKEKEIKSISLDIPFTYKVSNELNKLGLKVSKCDTIERLVEDICQLNSKN